jgi:hypothetical protein
MGLLCLSAVLHLKKQILRVHNVVKKLVTSKHVRPVVIETVIKLELQQLKLFSPACMCVVR